MIATSQNIPVDSLKSLWHTCFGDSQKYIDFFFDHMYQPDHTLVWEENGQVRSMLFLLDCFLQLETGRYDGVYIYAACTHPDFRSKGYMAALIQGAQTLCQKRGLCFTALVPATDSLFAYYHKFGYETALYCMRRRMDRGELAGFCRGNAVSAAYEPSAEPLGRIRDRLLGGNSLLWKPEVLSYAFAEHRFTGGQIIQVDGGYALFHEMEEQCHVDELICSPDAQSRLFALLMQASRANEFIFHLPPTAVAAQTLGGTVIPKGMLCAAGDKDLPFYCANAHVYIGLTLG